MSEKIETAEVCDLGPCAIEKMSAVNNDRKALRPTDRDVEAIRVEEEFRAPRRLDAL